MVPRMSQVTDWSCVWDRLRLSMTVRCTSAVGDLPPSPPSICMFPEAVRMQLTDLLPQGALLTEVQLLCPEIITAIPCKGRHLLALNTGEGFFWETWTPLRTSFGRTPSTMALPNFLNLHNSLGLWEPLLSL